MRGEPPRTARRQAAFRSPQNQDSGMPILSRRQKQGAAKFPIVQADSLDTFSDGYLLQACGRQLHASPHQSKFDRLSTEIPRWQIPGGRRGRWHHGPNQAHGRHFPIRACDCRLFGGINAALGVDHKIGLRGPARIRSIDQLGANGQTLVWWKPVARMEADSSVMTRFGTTSIVWAWRPKNAMDER